jgi:hypothetical protein
MTPFFMASIKACAKDLKFILNYLFDYGRTIWDRCLSLLGKLHMPRKIIFNNLIRCGA